jgi:hypothetical protein
MLEALANYVTTASRFLDELAELRRSRVAV